MDVPDDLVDDVVFELLGGSNDAHPALVMLLTGFGLEPKLNKGKEKAKGRLES